MASGFMKVAKIEMDYKDEVIGTYTLDWIDDNLWIGNLTAASNLEIIQEQKISRILSVDAWPLPTKITDLRNVQIMRIAVTDLPTEDLISHFGSAYNFIQDGVREGPVLVHCYHGVSRSATVVLAYMMKKYRMSFEAALEMARSRKRFVHPNPGFAAQLKLYETMDYEIDTSNKQYKMFRLYLVSDKVRTSKILPQSSSDVIQPDPSLEPILPDPRVYRCRRCRRILATEANIIPHYPREKYSWRDRRYRLGDDGYYHCYRIHFIEPMAWMKGITSSNTGKLYCPNSRCHVKLGSYSWSMGCLCPCGTKVAPGFYLVPSRVDQETVVKNIDED